MATGTLSIYTYRASLGRKHDRGVKVDFTGFKKAIPALMEDPDVCEIVVTDDEDYTVFHYKDGTVIFPRGEGNGTN